MASRRLFGMLLLVVAWSCVASRLAWGVIANVYPVSDMIEAHDTIAVASVDRADPARPAVVLQVQRTLRGVMPAPRFPVALTGDNEEERGKIVPRLPRGESLVLFLSAERNETTKLTESYSALGYASGTWFQLVGTVSGDQVAWRFTHVEPYLRRAFRGSTADLAQVVTDALVSLKDPPPYDASVEPGIGPEPLVTLATPNVDPALLQGPLVVEVDLPDDPHGHAHHASAEGGAEHGDAPATSVSWRPGPVELAVLGVLVLVVAFVLWRVAAGMMAGGK